MLTNASFGVVAGTGVTTLSDAAQFVTAFGNAALYSITTGTLNSAFGSGALAGTTTGSLNSAFGYSALGQNDIGSNNDAFGYFALSLNTGNYNDAFGSGALGANSTGFGNDAFGGGALANNTTGNNNVAFGLDAMIANSTGSSNVALGPSALYANSVGIGNVAVGAGALDAATGNYNVAFGTDAGILVTVGSNNIDIGNNGAATDAGIIRLGTAGTHGATYVAGISGTTTGLAATAVVVDANGQLGTISSSRRYKEDIEPMGDASDRLFKLRPVKFHYKKPDANGEKPIQYGLIAEEVADVFPELAVFNKEGQPETVAYHLLAGLLLNELQKEHAVVGEQQQAIDHANAQLAAQQALIENQKAAVARDEDKLAALQARAGEVDVLKAKLADLERLTGLLAVSAGLDAANVETVAQRLPENRASAVASQ